MIPISLKLKGIYSYQNKEQFIDFQQLCDAGLFGIFGSVGSGKSTILEAISFALYGETERLNKRENRGYNMMNLKSDNLLIDFIFQNGTDDKKYRFIVKGRRNTKKFEDVKAFAREAYVEKKEEWVTISANSAEEITGLSYINFRRTIIIPQGRFQEFLQLGDTDRTKMMKELFHLERFDLSGKTKLLEEKNYSKLTHLEGQLLQLRDVSKEKIEETELKIELLGLEIKKEHKHQKEIEAKEAEFKNLKELFEKIQLFERELNELKKQQPDFETLKKELKDFQYCQVHLKSKIEKVAVEKQKLDGLVIELSGLKNQFQTLLEQLEKLEVEFKTLKVNYQGKEELKKEADDFEKIIKIKQLLADIEKLKNRVGKGKTILDETETKIEKQIAEQKEVKSKIALLKNGRIDIVDLTKIKAWFNELNGLEKQQQDIENQIDEIGAKKDELSAKIKKILLSVGFEKELSEPSELDKFYSSNHSKLEKELEDLNDISKHLKVKQELSKYSENLSDGDACPVCGSKHHPEKMKTEDFSKKSLEIAERQQEVKKQMLDLANSEKQARVKISEYQGLTNILTDLIEKQKIVFKNIERHKKSYDFDEKYTETGLEKELEKLEKENKELKNLEQQLFDAESFIETERKNKEKYQKGINQIENELVATKASYTTLYQQIDLENIESLINLDEAKIKQKIEELNNSYEQIIREYEKTDGQINQLKPKKEHLKGIIDTKEKDLEQLQTEILKDEQLLQNEIASSKYESVSSVLKLLEKDYKIEEEEQKIQSFEKKIYSLKEQLLQLKQQAEGKKFDAEHYHQILEQLEKVKDKINQQNKELGSFEKDKREHQAKLIEKEKLTTEFKELSNRAEDLKTLKNLFKASGFVNYVSSVYLRNLVNAANKRFSVLTSQKLRLELTETNDFIIRDYLNEGKTRSVKTLSGGQTFQASLSLALALADNIQSINKSSNNFFFLDEGFGSLDKESLGIVFQSLKSLRKENRVVGVISHVEELQQEIDSHLKIVNDPETGTNIYTSWE